MMSIDIEKVVEDAFFKNNLTSKYSENKEEKAQDSLGEYYNSLKEKQLEVAINSYEILPKWKNLAPEVKSIMVGLAVSISILIVGRIGLSKAGVNNELLNKVISGVSILVGILVGLKDLNKKNNYNEKNIETAVLRKIVTNEDAKNEANIVFSSELERTGVPDSIHYELFLSALKNLEKSISKWGS